MLSKDKDNAIGDILSQCWVWFPSGPDQLGSIGQKWAGWFLHIGLLPDRICLAKTWHSQPELNWIWAGFVQYDPGHIWKNGTKSKSGKLVVGQKPGQMIPEHHLVSGPDAFGQTLTGHLDWIWVSFAQCDPCFLWKNGAETDAGSRIQHIPSGLILTAHWP